MKAHLLSILTLISFSVALEARGDTLLVQGAITGVTQIRSDAPGNNFGSDGSFIIGRTTAPAILRGLLSFDISSIPLGSTITGISLTLVSVGTGSTTNHSGSVALNLYDLTGDFVEGSGTAAGTPSTTSATWVTRDASSAWETEGGDFAAPVLSSVDIDPSLNAAGTISLFGSSDGFVTVAQNALDTSTALTLLLKLNDASEAENLRRAFFFYSDNATAPNTGKAPLLTIDYIPVPEPASCGLLLGGTAVLLGTRRRRSA